MNSSPNQKSSHIFMNFHEIKDHSLVSVLRFYESNEKDICQLPLQEYVHLLNEYLNALFELAKYEKYINCCETLVILCIDFNIQLYKGEDIYFKTLLRKAAAYYHLYMTDKAIKVTTELLKMNSKDKASRMLMEKCLLRKNRSIIDLTRAIVIGGFLSASLIVAIELFIVKPFFSYLEDNLSLMRNFIFLLSFSIFIFGELAQRGLIRYQLYKILEDIKLEKQNREPIF